MRYTRRSTSAPSKIDLLPYLDFDVDKCIEYAQRVNPGIQVLQVSASTGEGMPDWYQWIKLAHQARQFKLTGQVLTDGEGVLIDAWGVAAQLDGFVAALNREPPPLARIDRIEQQGLDTPAAADFLIIESRQGGSQTGVVVDAASCPSCIAESLDPTDRPFRYPFSNCTHCGPRLSIIDGIPYDRAHTSMAKFTLCDRCREEYENPADRRFHAQPNACPVCGPKAWLEPAAGESAAIDDLETCCSLLQGGGYPGD